MCNSCGEGFDLVDYSLPAMSQFKQKCIPLCLPCSDTICSKCLLQRLDPTPHLPFSFECLDCGEKVGVNIEGGYLLVQDGFQRVRDGFGSLQLPLNLQDNLQCLILRQFPIVRQDMIRRNLNKESQPKLNSTLGVSLARDQSASRSSSSLLIDSEAGVQGRINQIKQQEAKSERGLDDTLKYELFYPDSLKL